MSVSVNKSSLLWIWRLKIRDSESLLVDPHRAISQPKDRSGDSRGRHRATFTCSTATPSSPVCSCLSLLGRGESAKSQLLTARRPPVSPEKKEVKSRPHLSEWTVILFQTANAGDVGRLYHGNFEFRNAKIKERVVSPVCLCLIDLQLC